MRSLAVVTFVLLYFVLGSFAVGQDPLPVGAGVSPTPAASAAPAEVAGPSAPTYADKLIELLKKSGAVVAGFLVVAEIAMRAFPTKNPLSILLPLKYALDSLAFVLTWASSSVLVPLINAANKSQNKIVPKDKDKAAA
jgi:hypothetical protein